jgi:hypothetical protein
MRYEKSGRSTLPSIAMVVAFKFVYPALGEVEQVA